VTAPQPAEPAAVPKAATGDNVKDMFSGEGDDDDLTNASKE